jgi:Fructosamine kinase
MLALFGAPYLDRILAAYQEGAPLAAGWQARVPLHQLHPLLVHVCLFGGGYRGRHAGGCPLGARRREVGRQPGIDAGRLALPPPGVAERVAAEERPWGRERSVACGPADQNDLAVLPVG